MWEGGEKYDENISYVKNSIKSKEKIATEYFDVYSNRNKCTVF